MSQSLIAAVVVAALMLFASRAVAEYGYKIDPGPDVFSRESTSKKPKHGYSGWYKGPYSLYCDYERTPDRHRRQLEHHRRDDPADEVGQEPIFAGVLPYSPGQSSVLISRLEDQEALSNARRPW